MGLQSDKMEELRSAMEDLARGTIAPTLKLPGTRGKGESETEAAQRGLQPLNWGGGESESRKREAS